LEQALRQAEKSINDLKVTLELGSNEAVKEAVLQGLGVTIISENAIGKERRLGQLASLRVRGLNLQRAMYIAWDRRRALSIAAHLLLDFLQARVSPGDKP
jgi:DNA-binding transcriptional LysR family regulator